MNIQNTHIASQDFQTLLLDFWKEDLFRKKTFDQISKDFGLCGIDMPISDLEKCKSKRELNEEISYKLSQVNIQRLLYIVDLKETIKSDNSSLAEALVTRVAYKVHLRTFFTSKSTD